MKGMAAAFAGIAAQLSQSMGGPYHPSRVTWQGTPVLDSGGSITTPGTPVSYDCMAQVDVVTQAMRTLPEYTDKSVRILVLQIERKIDTDARIVVTAGPNPGIYLIDKVLDDAAGVYQDCMGRIA